MSDRIAASLNPPKLDCCNCSQQARPTSLGQGRVSQRASPTSLIATDGTHTCHDSCGNSGCTCCKLSMARPQRRRLLAAMFGYMQGMTLEPAHGQDPQGTEVRPARSKLVRTESGALTRATAPVVEPLYRQLVQSLLDDCARRVTGGFAAASRRRTDDEIRCEPAHSARGA